MVPHDASITYLQELKAQDIVGIAFNYSLHGLAYYRPAEALFARVAALDMFVQVQVERDQMHALAPVLREYGAPLLIDHCGRPDVTQGLNGDGFAALLRLAATGRATVKLSGFSKFSKQDFPLADVLPYAEALLRAFGANHCIWASDWPFLKAPKRLDYGPLLQLFGQMVPDAGDRKKILWDTPRRLFRFGR